jgi:hypothetical protein
MPGSIVGISGGTGPGSTLSSDGALPASTATACSKVARVMFSATSWARVCSSWVCAWARSTRLTMPASSWFCTISTERV